MRKGIVSITVDIENWDLFQQLNQRKASQIINNFIKNYISDYKKIEDKNIELELEELKEKEIRLNLQKSFLIRKKEEIDLENENKIRQENELKQKTDELKKIPLSILEMRFFEDYKHLLNNVNQYNFLLNNYNTQLIKKFDLDSFLVRLNMYINSKNKV